MTSARAREFRDRGFVTVKGLLPKPEAETYVRHLERLSGRTRESFERYRVGLGVLKRGVYRGWTLPDGVSKTREFWDLLVHPELLGVVREVLGPEACFLQHTDLHVGFSAVNWHRDSVNRRLGEGGDWDESEEPYRLARVGFYLQSHAESRFALGLVPGSHRRGGTLDEMVASEAAPDRGETPEKPYVLLGQPSLFDPRRAPAGQHTAWAYCHVPNGSTEDMTARIEARIESFAPGFRERILARSVQAPRDLEAKNANLVGGDISGGRVNFAQILSRPTLFSPYRTSDPSIFLCSSSTPPGPGVHGMCGLLAARVALRSG